jgi:hypothetical protein
MFTDEPQLTSLALAARAQTCGTPTQRRTAQLAIALFGIGTMPAELAATQEYQDVTAALQSALAGSPFDPDASTRFGAWCHAYTSDWATRQAVAEIDNIVEFALRELNLDKCYADLPDCCRDVITAAGWWAWHESIAECYLLGYDTEAYEAQANVRLADEAAADLALCKLLTYYLPACV